MCRYFKLIEIAIVMLIIVVAFVPVSAIQVSGDVWGVWTADDNPYEVTGDLRVPQESTLVIQPGCYIDFQGHYVFLVDTSAVFQAVGTESDSITFTTYDVATGWYGLRFLSADSSSILSYCIIQWSVIDDSSGAGVYVGHSNIVISHCSICYNEAYETEGGGLSINHSNVRIINNKIEYNIASFGGSGISFYHSEVIMINNVIKDNETYYGLGGEQSGGLGFHRCELLLRNNVIDNNYCGSSAGGIYVGYSTGLIDSNIISGNIASEFGGGVFFNRSQVIFRHNLLTNNNAMAVSSLCDMLSDLIIYNNTIYGNESVPSGWAIRIDQTGNDTLLNNIIWGNNANSIYLSGDTINFLYNNIEGGWPGEGNIDADPLFVDPDNGDFHLSWANYPIDDETKSPCIDTGAPWSPFDPDSTRADMGALPFDQSINNIDIKDIIPKSINLSQNYPNPFNASTTISYTLPCQSDVTIDIYDILGRKVQTLVSTNQPAGYHRVIWQADEFTSGVYFYKLKTGDYIETKKMMLLK